MGYRDDTIALEGRRGTLRREVAELEAALARLQTEGAALRQTVRRRRLRLALVRALRWLVRHPWTTILLLLILGVIGLVAVDACQQRQDRRRQAEAVLGHGCSTRLKVDASFRHARVLVNGTEVGTVPLDAPICRGYYRVQVVHERALPWQRVVSVGVQPTVELAAELVAFWPHQRPPGVLVLSSPPGAILFANGLEVGRTPVMVRSSLARPPELQLALWDSSLTRPLRLWKGEHRPRTLWFHLSGPAAEARP